MKTGKALSIRALLVAVLLSTPVFVANTAYASDPFIGQITMFGGNFAPRSWAFCDGQLLPISSNSALFSILGTTYGGDGRTTFGLPDLRGRVAMHAGNGPGLSSRSLGAKGGTETNTLTVNQLPSHNHTATATTAVTIYADNGSGTSDTPGGNVWAKKSRDSDYSDFPASAVTMAAGASSADTSVNVENTGGGQSVNNMQPFQVIHYIIALQGVYPSRS